MDKALATRLQFKIGEYCYFHMKGSDTPNEKLNARIDDYLPDQETYLVFVPDHKDSYYVPVDCLSPILSNSEKPDQISYNELPGYYRKTEDPPKDNMGNFQYPKKRQKGGNIRGGRDDDFRSRRFDNRNNQRYENRTEGRFEGGNDGSGYQRRDRRDRRGGGGNRGGRNDRNDRKDSEKTWKPNERGNRKQDASRVLSPTTDPDPQDVKVSGSDVVVAKKVEDQDEVTSPSEGAINPEFPTLKPQEKEKTAKQDESPAAFWQRMRKPIAAGCEDAKPQSPRSSTHIAEKEINSKNDAAPDNKPSNTPRDKAIDKAKGVNTQGPTESSKNITAKNEVKQEGVAPANETSKASESNISAAKEPVTRKLTRLALDESDTKNIVEPTDINSERAIQEISKADKKEVSEDLKAVPSKPQTSGPSALGDAIPKEISSPLNEENADEMRKDFVFTDHTCNDGAPTAFIDSRLSNEHQNGLLMGNNDKAPEDVVGNSPIAIQEQADLNTFGRVPQGAKGAATTTENQSSLENTCNKALQGHQTASFPDHMVSFPSGFDAPTDTECADSTDNVGNSSPITFMSQSDISTESLEGIDDASSSNAAGEILAKTQAHVEQAFTPSQIITAEPAETKAEQKSEQRIRILTKGNKDEFDYLNTNNESNATVDIPLSSVSRERSPEPEGGRKGQSKKVSFGDVTEISQTASSEVYTEPNTVMSEMMPNSYVDTNGETNDEMYYDESGNFNPAIGMHAPVLPMMMHPMVAGNEQIQIPQTFSMDPEGKDLPNRK